MEHQKPFQFKTADARHVLHFLSSPARKRASKAILKTETGRQNTVLGVFLPCLQSILNVILFLRLPSITAQAGIIQTTLIILSCVTSTLITAISLSAIASNGNIKQGGPYYIISRTLGLEVGGALGLLYYLGNTMACAMCVLGGVEAFLLSIRGDTPVMTDTTNGALGGSYESIDEIELGDGLTRKLLENEGSLQDLQVMAVQMDPLTSTSAEPLAYSPSETIVDTQTLSVLLLSLFTVFLGTGYQPLLTVSSRMILVLILLSIFSSSLGCFLFATDRFLGGLQTSDKLYFENIYPRYEPDPTTGITPTFMSLLALFYPSVTGILAGSNNSENLIDASKSIPNGTIGAIICSTFIYIIFAWLFGTTIANQTLKSRKFVVAAVAYPNSMVVEIGVLLSVVGAALGYMSSATTILAAIANDDSMPILNFIRKGEDLLDGGKGKHSTGVNKRALILTFALVFLPTLTGNLDHITPLTTMCYLLMYAGINCSCFLLGVTQSPGFRPTFRYFHWSVSFLGFLWCVALALIIDPAMACLALAMFLVLLTYNTKMVEKRKDWGDVFDSVKYNVVTQTLQSLSHTTTSDLNAKNWRPQLLTFVDMNSYGLPTNLYLLSLASQLKRGKGINIVVGIILRDLCQSQPQLEGHQGFEDENIVEVLSKGKDALQSYMRQEKMEGFAEVSITTRGGMCDAAWSAVLHSGLGPLSPNTILLSFPKRSERNGTKQYWSEKDFLKTITGIRNMKVALMILRGCHLYPRSQELVTSGIIDVWWIMHDGGILLLLPYILSKNAVWGKGGAKLRIFAVLTNKADPDQFKIAVVNFLEGVRIMANVTVIDLSSNSLEDDMRIGQAPDDVEAMKDSCCHDKTIGEVFSQIQQQIPYVPLSDQANMGLEHADTDELSFNSEDPLLDETTIRSDIEDDDAFTKIHRSRDRIKNARAINQMIRLHSSCSNLVVTNMPQIQSQYSCDFFEYVDAMCDGIDNVLLIRGSGKEVITTFA